MISLPTARRWASLSGTPVQLVGAGIVIEKASRRGPAVPEGIRLESPCNCRVWMRDTDYCVRDDGIIGIKLYFDIDGTLLSEKDRTGS